MNKITVIIFLIFWPSLSFIWAQGGNLPDFDLYLDYARFRGEQNLTMVEIYYSFNRDSIHHIPDGDRFVATYSTKLEIAVKDSVLKTIEWTSQDVIINLSELKPNQMINDVYGLLLGEGDFKIRMEIQDLPGEKSAFNQIELNIAPPQTESLWVSDIQVALQINRSEEKNRFIKNGLSIIPNPSNIFSLTWPVLYYYCEIYNIKPTDTEGDIQYNVIATIKDVSGNIIKKIPAKSKSTENNSVVELNKTLVSSLKSGAYNLSLEIVNLTNDDSASQSKQFYVYRPADYITSESEKSDNKDNLYLIFLTMTEEELDKEFEYVTYISNADEEDIYEELNLDGKRKFLAGFWSIKNNIIDMPTEVYRAKYLDRVNLATERYSFASKEGWRTARGRIMLIYGLPDNINKQYGGPDTKQYETWVYNGLEGGSIFVFLDISGYGNFQLVHSTVSTEINDPNWEENYLR